MNDLVLARILKVRSLLARVDALLLAAKEGLIHGGAPRPRERLSLERMGLLLRAYRAERGVSRPVLARELGLATGTVKNMERGRHWPTLATLSRLERLGFLPEDLREGLRRRPRR